IGTIVGCGSPRLLWAHVRDGSRAKSKVGSGFDIVLSGSLTEWLEPAGGCGAGIDNLPAPRTRDPDVLGLQVAVDDAGVVGRGQAIRDLGTKIEKAPERERSIADLLSQWPAVDKL